MFHDETLDLLDERITKQLSAILQWSQPLSVEHLLICRIHQTIQTELHILDQEIYQQDHVDEMTEVPTEPVDIKLEESRWGRPETGLDFESEK